MSYGEDVSKEPLLLDSPSFGAGGSEPARDRTRSKMLHFFGGQAHAHPLPPVYARPSQGTLRSGLDELGAGN